MIGWPPSLEGTVQLSVMALLPDVAVSVGAVGTVVGVAVAGSE